VSEPRDLKGLKIRVPPSDIFVRLIRALGANPTPLSYGEVFSALQTKLIDGAENDWTTFYTSRHFEVAGFWAESEHSYSPGLPRWRAAFSLSPASPLRHDAGGGVAGIRALCPE
jgi:TRAP-type C4-dicarboxylate transport system substrate-binding protein